MAKPRIHKVKVYDTYSQAAGKYIELVRTHEDGTDEHIQYEITDNCKFDLTELYEPSQ